MGNKYGCIVIPKEFANFLHPECEFVEMLKGCAEDGGHEIDTRSFDRMTGILKKVVSGERKIEREISVDDIDELVKDIRSGKNGLGLSWSYNVGHDVQGCTRNRFSATFVGRVMTIESINYAQTYCIDQFDVRTSNPDEEIMLEKGGKVFLESIRVKDRALMKNRAITMGFPVVISEEF